MKIFDTILQLCYSKFSRRQAAAKTSLCFGGNIMSKGTVKWFNNQKVTASSVTKLARMYSVHYTGLNMDGYKTLRRGC